MIDFTNALEEFNHYRGSEKKKTLLLNNKKYLVKFPDPIREKNKNISYINNAFSEYIGSNIFKMVGIDTQNTILGIYNYNGKEKIVCACEDFTTDKDLLYEFELLVLSYNPDKKINTELYDILEVILKSKNSINPDDTQINFWNMFIIDAFIGNTDRHNGNWGFIFNKDTKTYTFSPIYDCGSCLNPLLEDTEIEKMNDTDIKNLSLNCYSCFKENGQKINYLSFIKDKKNKECNEALIRMFKKINLDEIYYFIDNISCLSESRKNFYKEILDIRYNVLKKVYEQLLKGEKQND